jgi:outer membrane immunogenic protein
MEMQQAAGWTIGAGYEWMIAPSWIARAEYLYYSLGNNNTNNTATFASPVAITRRQASM